MQIYQQSLYPGAGPTPADDVIVALMQGMGSHVLTGEPDVVRELQAQISKAIAKFRENPEMVRPTIPGAMLAILRTHSEKVGEHHVAQLQERRALVVLLTEAITTLAGATNETAERMDGICADLERSQSLDTEHALVEAMEDCLKRLRVERDLQHQTANKLMQGLRAGLLQVGETLVDIHAPEPMDPATGLPAMTAALEAFDITIKEKREPYTVCVMVPGRMRTINARLGYGVGDQILAAVKDRMMELLVGDDLLFRWRGPCIVALLKVTGGDLLQLKRRVAQSMSNRLEKTFEVGSRLALVPITCRWEFVPLEEPISDVCEHINRFIASQDLENGGGAMF